MGLPLTRWIDMTAVLQTQSLCKRFGSLTAVEDLSLEVFDGEVFGFLGPNGAGKTTSIRMITGLLKPDRGEVRIHGKLLSNGDKLVRAQVGICPQEIVLWERLTCLEQLQFTGQMYNLPAAAVKRRSLELLKALDLESRKNTQSRYLSGGMKRRLNLLLALVHDPDLVVLDEPEAGLDPQSRILVREYIRSLARQKTIIFTTHNMDEAERISDRIAIIDHGRLLVTGSIAEVKQQHGTGQSLEIQLQPPVDPSLIEAFLSSFPDLELRTAPSPQDPCLVISGGRILTCLPQVIEFFNSRSTPIGEVRLRESTLEDVFIRLTGRRLRE